MNPTPTCYPISPTASKKQERIVRVWDVKVSGDLSALILESEDGCLWQFCDVGLGWTRFITPLPSWKVNQHVQNYLPANVNPRPPNTEPWEYRFTLSKNAVLWVKKGKQKASYVWGIKKAS